MYQKKYISRQDTVLSRVLINQIEDRELAKKLQKLRTIRNRLVHEGLPQEFDVEELLNNARETDESLKRYLDNLIRQTE